MIGGVAIANELEIPDAKEFVMKLHEAVSEDLAALG